MTTHKLLKLLATAVTIGLLTGSMFRPSATEYGLPFRLAVVVGGSALVYGYFAWAGFQASRNVDRLLEGERMIRATRTRGIAKLWAIFFGATGFFGLAVGLFMWLDGAGIHTTVKLPKLQPMESGSGDPAQGEQRPYVMVAHNIDLTLWWLPVTFGLLLMLFGVYLWQRWKYTFYVVTSIRYIEQRQPVPYMPWLPMRFDQTPYEQIIDQDDRETLLGNLATAFGKGWGTIIITRRLMKASDSELPKNVYRLIPDYEDFSDELRKAREAAANLLK